MELIVDGRPCDGATTEGPVWGFDANELTDPLRRREGRSIRIALLPTRTNRTIFLDDELPAGVLRFNQSLHEAELCSEGEPLLRGTVRLLEASDEGYRVEVRGGAVFWARRAAAGWFHDFPVAWEGRLTAPEIAASWTEAAPVKFLPVHRDSYEAEPSSVGLAAVRRILSTGDYHPFLRIDDLLRALFADAGYTIESRFMEGAFFRSLHVSGAYAAADTAAADSRMGFFARRRSDATAEADAAGKVYATPASAVASVGNFVDAFVPTEEDADGNPMTDVYARSGCLRIEEGRILFRPPTQVQVAFEFRIRYLTDVYILNRERLKGFDTAYLGGGCTARFPLANPYIDRRGGLVGGRSYRVVVFDHTGGISYRLVGTAEDGTVRVLCAFEGRSAALVLPVGAPADALLQAFDGSAWRYHGGDWALYDGHIAERGRIEAEATLRTPPETVGPDAPRDFRTVSFSGAEPGMKLTLKKECSLRPLFSRVPGAGSKLLFGDVSRLRVRQSVLLEALIPLFNLRVFTDEEARTVYIEPEKDFYDRTRIVDWSAKIDPAVPVVLSDRALDEHEKRRYGYLAGEGAAARQQGEEPFGDWVATTASPAAKMGEQRCTNPLFAPTVSVSGSVSGAPSAWLLSVGDRDDASGGEGFTPRIVSFCGLKPLPPGECWDFPAPSGLYPLAGFHLPAEGITLCFDDGDGIHGLRRFHEAEEERRSTAQRLSLALRLTPREAEALCHRSDGVNAGIDTVFLLRVGGVALRCILLKAEGVDPAAGSVRCLFETWNGEGA